MPTALGTTSEENHLCSTTVQIWETFQRHRTCKRPPSYIQDIPSWCPCQIAVKKGPFVNSQDCLPLPNQSDVLTTFHSFHLD